MTRLRIGIDARELLGNSTGVGRYLGELVQRWTGRPDADRRQLILYAPEYVPLTLPTPPVEYRIVRGGRGTWWEQMSLRRAVAREKPDVFFAPAYTAPLGTGVPLAVTVHDVSFVAHPEWFRTSEGLRRRWLTRRAVDIASVVFTVSHFSESELLKYFRVDPSRIRVIPQGVTSRALKEGVRPAREPMVLFVGSLFNRRRIPDLIAAFARATADLPAGRLVVVGDDRTWPPQDLRAAAAQYGVDDRTSFLSYIGNSELADLYSRASVFAFLSEYEGFGLTPLEALSAGVPPVVLDTPVAREVYGEAAVFVARGDIAGTAAALRRFLLEPESAARILEKAPGVLARYSWQTAADRTLEELERIAER